MLINWAVSLLHLNLPLLLLHFIHKSLKNPIKFPQPNSIQLNSSPKHHLNIYYYLILLVYELLILFLRLYYFILLVYKLLILFLRLDLLLQKHFHLICIHLINDPMTLPKVY